MKEAEDIRNNYALLKTAFNVTPNMTFVKNTEFVYVAVSDEYARYLGKSSSKEVVGKTDYEIFEPHLADKHRKEDIWILEHKGILENTIEGIAGVSGETRYDSITKYCLVGEHDEVLGIYGVQFEVTQDVMARNQYEKEVQYLFELDENVCVTYLMDVDDWCIINAKGAKKYDVGIGYSTDIQFFCEKAKNGVLVMESDAYRFYERFDKEEILSIYRGGQRNIIMEYRRKFQNKEVRWVQDSMRFLKNPENGHLLLALIITDIEVRKQKEHDLIRRAETDSLTGVLNRDAFLKKVQQLLQVEGCNGKHALFMLDVDNFKQLNDTQGHQIGDRFLVEMSTAIRASFRNTDIVGRLGGDEFIVMMRFVPNETITQKNARELLKNINKVCSFYEMSDLSVSIGISHYPDNGTTFDELYEQADKALYHAKRHGKSRYEFAVKQQKEKE